MSNVPNTSKSSSPSLTFMVLAVGAASFSMLQSLLAPVLPTLQNELDTSQSAVSWVLIAWLLSAAVATPILGKVGDMIGKARTLVLALAAIGLGSLIAALAPSIELVIAGRIVQGLGGAIVPLSFGIIRDEFPPARVPSAVGILSAVIAVGSGVGTILAGPIVDLFGWHGLFWVPLAVVTVTATLAFFFVPESPVKSGGTINWLAAALLAAWLIALLLPLSLGTRWGWGSPEVIGLFVAAVVLAAAWVTVEVRSANPVIDMKMMRLPAVWTSNLVALLFGAAMFAVWVFLPQLIQVPSSAGYGFGATVSEAGWVMLPMLVSMAVAGVFSGRLARLVPFKLQLAGASAVIALSCVSLALLHQSIWEVALVSGVYGIGLGLAYAALTSVIVQSVPASQTGTAIGMNANIRTIGGAIGTAVMTAVVTARHTADGVPAEQGFVTGFLLFAGVAALAMVVSLLIPGARRAEAGAVAVPAE
ncbi:MAG TPA: MFS transporter [Devosia sp.]|jgi:EmrB/QacA subfamily drug resistance transporter|uniref:MFS transporter n=1 Tax=Devosia sp. TaxID=1871048 RepID=UPI002DDCE2DF|nr:MFS transporter [Devosia sp.]HEV2515239.1 MFS transporter [Devosia sp.]